MITLSMAGEITGDIHFVNHRLTRSYMIVTFMGQGLVLTASWPKAAPWQAQEFPCLRRLSTAMARAQRISRVPTKVWGSVP